MSVHVDDEARPIRVTGRLTTPSPRSAAILDHKAPLPRRLFLLTPRHSGLPATCRITWASLGTTMVSVVRASIV
jgi:hypothetical protein